MFVFTPPENAPPPTPTATVTPVPPRSDTVGMYKDGVFYLRNSNTTGWADITAAFGGNPSDLPVAGDWNGDGVDTIGVCRSGTGFFFLSDTNTSPTVSYNVPFGNNPAGGILEAERAHHTGTPCQLSVTYYFGLAAHGSA